MNCISPPPLDDAQLLAYLDYTAGPGVARHVAECAFCRKRAAQLARMARRLATGLYRASCPSSAELGEYHLGLLSGRAAHAISAHVSQCALCARELAQLASFLGNLAPEQEPAAPAKIAAGLRILIARLVDPGWDAEVQLATASLYSAGSGPMTLEAGEVQMTLDIREDEDAPHLHSLLGLVSGLSGGESEVDVWDAGQLLHTVPLDNEGRFVATNLPSGTYELVLRAPGVEIHVPSLTC